MHGGTYWKSNLQDNDCSFTNQFIRKSRFSIKWTDSHYTRRRFGGRQPLCGTGVTSRIAVTSRPTAWSARMAASRPAPGPLTVTSSVFMPCSMEVRAAVSAAICAANGVDLREPLNPRAPALDQETALPCVSVIVTIVLLKVERMCAIPDSIFFFTRRLRVCCLRAICSATSFAYYFFLFATVLRGPLRVRALFFVCCPRTGRPRRWRIPR